MSFFQNTCKPEGIGGKIMVNMMNAGHSSMAEWGFTHIEIRNDYRCLDIGCGGGANVKKLLVKTPYGKVIGIDYSEVSVIKSSKINKAEEFYLLPVGDKLIQYDKLAVNTIVENKDGEVSSCDIACTDNLEKFNADYLRYTTEVCNTCIDHDLSDEYMVIGTSAIVNVELDGAVGMNSGIFNNPFMIWGRYRMDGEKALLSISFQFHHTQMDGAHAGKFLKNLQEEIERLPYLLS